MPGHTPSGAAPVRWLQLRQNAASNEPRRCFHVQRLHFGDFRQPRALGASAQVHARWGHGQADRRARAAHNRKGTRKTGNERALAAAGLVLLVGSASAFAQEYQPRELGMLIGWGYQVKAAVGASIIVQKGNEAYVCETAPVEHLVLGAAWARAICSKIAYFQQ